MKAWLLDKLEGIANLRLADMPTPAPGPDEALVSIMFAGLNPADRYLAEAQYPAKLTFPHILGRDGMGIIDSLGSDVKNFKPGDRVILLRSEVGMNRPGTFAEKVAVPAESLAVVPSGWTDQQAAGAPLVYLTAHQALTQWGNLKPSVVLITGASGGVGVATVQLAAASGHTVIALSRSQTKRKQLETLGAKLCFDPTDPTWPNQIKAAYKVDLAIDSIGGPSFNQLLRVMAYRGKISAVGRLAGPVPDFNTASLFFRRLQIGGVAVGDYSPAESQSEWNTIVATLNTVSARPLVDSVFAFDHLIDAFQKLELGPLGKVLLQSDVGVPPTCHSFQASPHVGETPTPRMNDESLAILPPGTQVVSIAEVRGTDGKPVHPSGAVGIVIQSPADYWHSYRVRFLDGFEASFLRSGICALVDFQRQQISPGPLIENDLHQQIIYRCVVGSRAYGLDDEQSDTDRRGIYLPTANRHWSLYGVPEQLENSATEEVYWEARKFVTLALKANPNILECLYTPLVEFATPLAQELLSLRSKFLSRMV